MKWSSIKSLICPAICASLCVLQVVTYHQLRDLQAANARLHKAIGYDDERARGADEASGLRGSGPPVMLGHRPPSHELQHVHAAAERESAAGKRVHPARGQLHRLPTMEDALKEAGYDSWDAYQKADDHEMLFDDDMTAEERRLHTEAVRTWKASHYRGMDFQGPHRHHISRRLGALMTIGTTATSGCFAVTLSGADSTFDLSTDACNSNRCPPCFIASGTAHKVILNSCSSARWKSGTALSNQMMQFDLINADTTNTITFDASGGLKMIVGAKQSIAAYCSSASSDAMYFPSTVFCPSGCDANTPNGETGTAFSTVTCGLSVNEGGSSTHSNVCQGR